MIEQSTLSPDPHERYQRSWNAAHRSRQAQAEESRGGCVANLEPKSLAALDRVGFGVEVERSGCFGCSSTAADVSPVGEHSLSFVHRALRSRELNRRNVTRTVRRRHRVAVFVDRCAAIRGALTDF